MDSEQILDALDRYMVSKPGPEKRRFTDEEARQIIKEAMKAGLSIQYRKRGTRLSAYKPRREGSAPESS